VDALLVKTACAIAGFILAVAILRRGVGWSATKQLMVWRVLLALGAIALACAAFLRWFS
jgi:hypothetical protein